MKSNGRQSIGWFLRGEVGKHLWSLNVFWLVMLLAFVSISLPAAPNFNTTNPASFFTNVSSRLLSRELNLDLTRIQIYPTNQYTPAVHRLLQVTANIYDATTTNVFPTVFRPLFSTDATGTNIFITGYQQVVSVTGIGDDQLAAPFAIDALALAQMPFTNRSVNLFGVPWIIGARKGLPNFNQLYMRNLVQMTRKLEVTRTDANRPGALATNQMFIMSITNRIGYSFWNSYNSNYLGNATVYFRDIVSMTLSNGANQWQSFGGNPFPAQFALATNLAVWPGSAWNSSGIDDPSQQSADPRSFVSGYWDFSFLPQSNYRYYLSDFAPIAAATTMETGIGFVPKLPDFQLMTTNWLQAFILDGTNVIDYVQFSGPSSTRNLTREIADSNSSYAGYWNTNLWGGGGSVSPTSPTWGVYNQITTAKNPPGGSGWKTPPDMPAYVNTPALAGAYFSAFFTGMPVTYINGIPQYDTNLTLQVPYTPTRYAWELTLWQANDPLVHYLASDLSSLSPFAGIHRADDLTSSGFNFSNPRLNSVLDRYQPWGRNWQMGQLNNVDANAYNSRLRDPLVWGSDNWDFPTGQAWNLNWLGRVHRGTSWQTVYLKNYDVLQEMTAINNVGTNTWKAWTGVASQQDISLTCPVADRQLVSHLAAILNTNDLQTQFSVNNPDPNAWVGLMNGMTALTNTTEFPASYFPPTYATLILSSNSPQTAAIATAICASQPFQDIGDILAMPQLSAQSPFLNQSDYIPDTSDRLNYDIGEEAYEAIPSQLLPLLRADSIGTIIPTNGEMHVHFSGYDGHDYAIQASSNLVNWTNVSTNTPVNGTFNLIPPQPASLPRQFYRSILLQ